MKVLNLLCANDHRFEGWFASEDDYRSQDERGLLACPLCGDAQVSRLPSAPRLNVSRQRDAGPRHAEAAPSRAVPALPDRADAGDRPRSAEVSTESRTEMQAQILRAVRHMIDHTEDVGARFPEEARRIHYGEAEERSIRGSATAAEAEALVEEGIEVVSVRLPPALKGPLQ